VGPRQSGLAQAARDLNGRAGPTLQATGRPGLPAGLRHGVEALSGVSLGALQAHLLSPRPARLTAGPDDAAPVQLVLQNPLPPGQFRKAALRPYRADMTNTINAFRAHWLAVRARFALVEAAGFAAPQTTQLRDLYQQDVRNLEEPLENRFSDAKRQRFVGMYDRVRAAEGAYLLQQVTAELAHFTDVDQLLRQTNASGRMITSLDARMDQAGGDNRLFGDDGVNREAWNHWRFGRPNPPGPDVQWTIAFVLNAAAAVPIHAAVAAGAHTITMTVRNGAIPAAHQGVQECAIADAITFALRDSLNVGGANVFAPGAAAGALGENDREKVASLREIYRQMMAEQALFDARPAGLNRPARMRQITARFDDEVASMNLDHPAKRALFEQFPGLQPLPSDTGFGVRAASHGLAHQNRTQSMARGLGDPAGDAAAIGVRVITPALIEHMIAVGERNNLASFSAMGLVGGHDTLKLRNFVARHPNYCLVPSETQEMDIDLNGHVHALRVQKFRQFRWNGVGPPPAGLHQRPPSTEANWVQAVVPKTTVDHLLVFLQDGRRAYLAWRQANPALTATPTFGQTAAGAAVPHAASPSGVEYAGFVRDDPVNAMRKLETLFVSS
jgi:hypothetical protein